MINNKVYKRLIIAREVVSGKIVRTFCKINKNFSNSVIGILHTDSMIQRCSWDIEDTMVDLMDMVTTERDLLMKLPLPNLAPTPMPRLTRGTDITVMPTGLTDMVTTVTDMATM